MSIITRLSPRPNQRGRKKVSKPVWAALLAGMSAVAFLDAEKAKAATFNIIQLTDNRFNDVGPQISGPNIVWQGGEYPVNYSQDYEIFFYNGKTTTQLTNNSLDATILKFLVQMQSGRGVTSITTMERAKTLKSSSITAKPLPS